MKKSLLALSLAAITLFTGCDNADKISKAVTTSGLTITKVVSQQDQTMTLDDEGNLWATGTNDVGEFGNSTAAPVGAKYTTLTKVASNVKDFSISSQSSGLSLDAGTLMVDNDGKLWASGSNASGKLGLGSSVTAVTDFTAVTDGTGTQINNVKSVAVGLDYALILKTDGKVYGCGSNALGQLGMGLIPSVSTFTQITLPTLTSSGNTALASKIIANTHYWLADNWGVAATSGIITTTGELLMTGSNGWNKNGMGSDLTSFTEVTQFGQNVTDVAIGGMNTYVAADGKLYGTGDNAFGILPGTTNSNLFNELTTGVTEGIVSVTVGVTHGMFITESGKLYGVGVQNWGQTGSGSTSTLSSFTQIIATDNDSNPVTFSELSACPTNTFVVSVDGKLFGAGDFAYGELGNGATASATSFQQITE